MPTSSKLRRLRRLQKRRRQRSVMAVVLIVILVIAANVVFANAFQSDAAEDLAVVTVCAGDSLWSIAQEYKPENMDIRKYVRVLASYNGIDDCVIDLGQVVRIPNQ